VAVDGHGLPNPNYVRRPAFSVDTPESFFVRGLGGDRIAEAIEFEVPLHVACRYLDPVQNSVGCFPPPPGYFQSGTRDLRPVIDVLLLYRTM